MFLVMLQQGAEPNLRYALINELSRRLGDVGGRAALQKVSLEDADPQLREVAAKALQDSHG